MKLKKLRRAEFFCSTRLPLASTRWFDQLLKLSTLLEEQSINLSNIKHEYFFRYDSSENIFGKILGNAENRTRGCWVRSANATSVLCLLHLNQKMKLPYMWPRSPSDMNPDTSATLPLEANPLNC